MSAKVRQGSTYLLPRVNQEVSHGQKGVQQGGKLTGTGTGAVDGLIGAYQGQSVSLSADGDTFIAGGETIPMRVRRGCLYGIRPECRDLPPRR